MPTADLPVNPHLLTIFLFQIYSESTATVLAAVPSHVWQGKPTSEKPEMNVSAWGRYAKMINCTRPYLSFVASICHSLRACGLFVTSVAVNLWWDTICYLFLIRQLYYSGNLTLADLMVYMFAWISHIFWSSVSWYWNFGLQQKQGMPFAYENSLGTPASLI